MAVEAVTGATPAWFVEYDTAPSKILAHHWPDVPNYGDVTAVDWASMPPVDIITGGSPCQDLSAAGKRAGMTEGTRSNLWVNMREAIRIIRPKLVVWENVLGALSAKAASDSDMEPGARPMGNQPGGHLRALGRVLGDLSEIGYDAEWTTLRASDIGAPHNRARVFLTATPADSAGARRGAGENLRAGRSDAEANRRGGSQPERGSSERDGRAAEDVADPEDDGRDELDDSAVRNEACSGWVREPPGGDRRKSSTDTNGERWGEGAEQPIAGPPEIASPVGSEPPATHPEDDGLARAGTAPEGKTCGQ